MTLFCQRRMAPFLSGSCGAHLRGGGCHERAQGGSAAVTPLCRGAAGDRITPHPLPSSPLPCTHTSRNSTGMFFGGGLSVVTCRHLQARSSPGRGSVIVLPSPSPSPGHADPAWVEYSGTRSSVGAACEPPLHGRATQTSARLMQHTPATPIAARRIRGFSVLLCRLSAASPPPPPPPATAPSAEAKAGEGRQGGRMSESSGAGRVGSTRMGTSKRHRCSLSAI